MPNKYIALVIVLIILIVSCYYSYRREKLTVGGGKSKKKTKRSRTKSSGRGRDRRSPRRKNSRSNEHFSSGEDPEDPEDSDEDSDSSRSDGSELDEAAKELYNLVHEPLCKGVQKDEFEELAGNLAGPIAFIELKQLYSECIDRNMDPMNQITVEDYIRILKKEDGE
jgi:FtsZ-interacting cell division protein ZipA